MADSDPKALRVEAVRSLIDSIASDASLSEGTRVGIVGFSDDARVIQPLNNVSAVRKAIGGLTFPASGNTDLLSALHKGYQVFQKADTFEARKPVMLFLTDGSPYDSRKLREPGAYFLELQAYIRDKLKPYGCAIYAIGMDVSGGWAETESRWHDVADAVYGAGDVEQLNMALGEIVQQVYGIPPAAREVVTPEQKLVFSLPPYSERLEVYVLSAGKDGHLTLHSPSGSVVKTGEEGTSMEERGSYRKLVIAEPEPGDWTLKAVGGEFAVYRRLVHRRLKLVKPGRVHPLGKPMVAEVAFMKDETQELSGYKLRFSGQVIAPDGREYRLEFAPKADGGYISRSAIIPDVKGPYVLKLIAQGGDAFRSETAETIIVREMPYVVIHEPTGMTLDTDSLEVRASLYRGSESLPEQELANAPVLAKLQYPNGEVKTAWLELAPGNVFFGSFGLREKGQYRLEVKTADSWAASETMSFRLRMGLFSYIHRFSGYAWIGVISLLPLVVLAFFIRLSTYPRVTGSVSGHLASGDDALLGQARFYRKRWGLLRLRRRDNVPSRVILITGLSGSAVLIWYRKGVLLARRRLNHGGILNMGKHSLKYA
jgi:hypothetical protein